MLARLPRDFLAGAALLAFCAVAYGVSLGIGEAPPALAQNVQPATFPRMVLAVVAVLTVVMMVAGMGAREPERRFPKAVMLATGAMMIAFVMAFGAFGPLAAIFVYCLVMPMIWGKRLSVPLVIYALLFPAAVHLVFVVLLGVYFPPGPVEDFLKTVF